MLLFKVDYYNTERGYDFLKIYNSQTEVARLDGWGQMPIQDSL